MAPLQPFAPFRVFLILVLPPSLAECLLLGVSLLEYPLKGAGVPPL